MWKQCSNEKFHRMSSHIFCRFLPLTQTLQSTSIAHTTQTHVDLILQSLWAFFNLAQIRVRSRSAAAVSASPGQIEWEINWTHVCPTASMWRNSDSNSIIDSSKYSMWIRFSHHFEYAKSIWEIFSANGIVVINMKNNATVNDAGQIEGDEIRYGNSLQIHCVAAHRQTCSSMLWRLAASFRCSCCRHLCSHDDPCIAYLLYVWIAYNSLESSLFIKWMHHLNDSFWNFRAEIAFKPEEYKRAHSHMSRWILVQITIAPHLLLRFWANEMFQNCMLNIHLCLLICVDIKLS